MPRNRVLGYRAATRSKMIFNTLSVGILLVILSALQVSLFGRLRPFGAVPDLMLSVVLCFAFFSGRYTGAIVGIAAGFLIECIGSQGISLLPVFYLFVGYVAGHYARAVQPKRFVSYLFYLGCGLFLRAVMTFVYHVLTHESIHLPKILLYAVLPEMVGTALMGCLLYFPMKLFCTRFNRGK